MINIARTETAPDCLKKQQNYECENVLEKLKIDFFGKCYICETSLFSTNVEHFKAHRGDKKLKFEWTNLFLACGHCNNIKLSTDILNCTDSKHDVENWISYKPIFVPVGEVEISAKRKNKLTIDTVNILNKVYNGHTNIKTTDAQKIKDEIVKEMIVLQRLLLQYSKEKYNELEITDIEKDIRKKLHKGSKLTAFKRQVIKDNKLKFLLS